eukprot:16435841-Heterocapsa_arctica.AAC.1
MSTGASAVVCGDCHDCDGRTLVPGGGPLRPLRRRGRAREVAISGFGTRLLLQKGGPLVRDPHLLQGKFLVCHCWIDEAGPAEVLVGAYGLQAKDVRQLVKGGGSRVSGR